jgi:hypothetical protein
MPFPSGILISVECIAMLWSLLTLHFRDTNQKSQECADKMRNEIRKL